ncbi:MAG: hydroxymethylpyrimidine/phosphomethylpyrimidine kinase [Sphingomonadales bacterium]|jgi:hydroxymethylpyrimidine/phosphomethylpyrimidine kinase|nr:hydroxymethylpyrimidine/phosphomethylpyrimidine kinase [Sphingomonadales bacterium]
MKPPRILIVAGSDSGGGAGIQADIKTVTMLGGFAATAITAITAQNSLGVAAVMPVPADMVLKQIEAVLGDIGADAVKIGMIGSAATAAALAERLERLDGVPIVFDPVMVATSGDALAEPATIAGFERLMRVATLITPNAPELAALAGRPVESLEQLRDAALALAARTGGAVLAKGGHLDAASLTDLLVEGEAVHSFAAPRIDTPHSHGTGCTLASAIAVHLAHGRPPAEAVARARSFVRTALRAAPGFGAGHGPMGHHDASPGEIDLNQVTLPAVDYDASVAFYRTIGLTQIVDSPGRYARFECPGGATLSIHVEADAKAGDAIICLESAGLDHWVERLQAAGIAFETRPTDQRWGWREAHLRDPAGNRLCLYQAGENRRFPPWRLPSA